MRRLSSILALALALAGCLQRRIVNPDIVTRGAPGNRARAQPSTLPAPADPNAEFIFLGSSTVTVPAGAVLPARLSQSVSTAKNQSGDSFEATLAEPLVRGDTVVAPAGTLLRGQITDVRTPDEEKRSELSLNLLEIMINNRWFPLQTDLLVFQTGSRLADSPALSGATSRPSSAVELRELHVVLTPGASITLSAGQTLVFHLIRGAVVETFGTGRRN